MVLEVLLPSDPPAPFLPSQARLLQFLQSPADGRPIFGTRAGQGTDGDGFG